MIIFTDASIAISRLYEFDTIDLTMPTKSGSLARLIYRLKYRRARYNVKMRKCIEKGQTTRAKFYRAIISILSKMIDLLTKVRAKVFRYELEHDKYTRYVHRSDAEKHELDVKRIMQRAQQLKQEKKNILRRAAEKFADLLRQLRRIRMNMKPAGVVAGVAAAGAAGYYGYKKHKSRKQQK